MNQEFNLKWIQKTVPCFNVDPKKIAIIQTPTDFYSQLKLNISKSKSRIVLSSLYLGTGNLEQDLVQAIDQNLETNPNTNVKILLDHNRGQRGQINSKSILMPLITKFNTQFSLYLYHTPNLRGILKKFTPERTNEIIGVQHMKIYITDNDIIISGANLSNDYFVNRQDRYIWIKDCENLCNFFNSLIDIVSSFSFRVDNSGLLSYPEDTHHPVNSAKHEFGIALSNKLNALFQQYKNKEQEVDQSMAMLFPLIQMNDALIRIDEQITNDFFKKADKNSKIFLAVGYFNLTDEYMNTIVRHSSADFDLLLSSPEANGFFDAQGFSKNIPNIYSYLEHEFLKYCTIHQQQERIKMFEYKKENWTFHAKGLWYYPDYNSTRLPNATIIGSSNFGHRSVYRDLEANLLIYTRDADLQKQLDQERINLFENSSKVDFKLFLNETRIAPIWLKMLTRSFRSFF